MTMQLLMVLRQSGTVNWKLLKLVWVQRAEDDLTGGLDSACIVSRERVLGRQAPLRP
jgi:hypothetical protein